MSFSIALRRALLALAVTGASALAVPALASASQSQSFAVDPCNSGCSPNNAGLPAGGAGSYTLTANFDTSGSKGAPQRLTVELAPGVLLAVEGQNGGCILVATHSSACKIGGGVIQTSNFGSLPFDSYLVPSADPAHDVAGIDMCLSGQTGTPTCDTTHHTLLGHAEVSLHQLPSGPGVGNLVGDLTVSFVGNPEAAAIQSITTSVNGKLNGLQFTRMPTTCSPAVPSSLTITYATAGAVTTNATTGHDFGNFLMGCDSLPFTPKATGSAKVTGILSAGKYSVQQTTQFSQPLGQAASKAATIQVPASVLSPNTASLSLANTNTPIGTAASSSPLLPAGNNTLKGNVTLTWAGPMSGQPPFLVIDLSGINSSNQLPVPIDIKLYGALDPNTNSFIFGAPGAQALPDVPLTSLVVNLKGGPKSLLETTCQHQSGRMNASYLGYNAKQFAYPSTLKVTGCPAPTLTNASLTGLKADRPVLKFTVNRGRGMPNVKSFTIGPNNGLTFGGTGGVLVTGCGSVTAKVVSGKLQITTAGGAACSVTLKKPTLVESSALHTKAQKSTVSFSFPVAVTDVNGNLTNLHLNVKNSS